MAGEAELGVGAGCHMAHDASALPVTCTPTYKVSLVTVVVPETVEVSVVVEVTVLLAVQPTGSEVTGAPDDVLQLTH